MVISRKPSLLCGKVFRYNVTVTGLNLAEPIYFFSFSFFFSLIFYYNYHYNNCLSCKR